VDIAVKIFSGRASQKIALNIAKHYGVALGNVIVTDFSDGEFQPSFEETVRGLRCIYCAINHAANRKSV